MKGKRTMTAEHKRCVDVDVFILTKAKQSRKSMDKLWKSYRKQTHTWRRMGSMTIQQCVGIEGEGSKE